MSDDSDRRSIAVEGSRWGGLILPSSDEERARSDTGLRIILLASFEFGYMALEAIKAYARRFPGRVSLAALVTDDPMTPTARIGLRKRVWKHMTRDEIVNIETAIVEAALVAGAPVFTGEIKTPGFHALLDEWRPDAIVSCVFGQVIDSTIIARPAYGIYNFHPTDLAHGFGAGPTPAEDLAARGMTSTVWTIHHVIEAVDAGGVVAVSPSINVADAGGKLPADPLMIYDKLVEPVGCLAAGLVDALWRRFASGTPGKLDRLDVAPSLPADMAAHLQAPIRAERHGTALPVFDPSILGAFTAR